MLRLFMYGIRKKRKKKKGFEKINEKALKMHQAKRHSGDLKSPIFVASLTPRLVLAQFCSGSPSSFLSSLFCSLSTVMEDLRNALLICETGMTITKLK